MKEYTLLCIVSITAVFLVDLIALFYAAVVSWEFNSKRRRFVNIFK
jgi:hypothetical protein